MTDREIPERVVSYYEAPLQVPILRRDLKAEERAALTARADLLRAKLAPFSPTERKAIGIAISDMMQGIPQMQRRSAAEAVRILDGYCATLRERPAWAIIEACAQVRSGKIAASVDFAPSEGRLNKIVGELLEPYRARLQAAERILEARA